jgi:tetratricopeptide (TPR) repeat protein
MSFLSGLYPYQVVMLVAGALLFLVSLVLLVILAAAGKEIGKLYLFFALSIVMIGFPAYSKIEITKDGVTLEKDTQQLLQNPTDKALRDSVSSQVRVLSARPLSDPNQLSTLARAQIALGDNGAAERNLTKALKIAPTNVEAVAVQKRLELDRNLEQFTARVEQSPNDPNAKAQLEQVVHEAGQMQLASPVTITNLARAHAALGNQAQAIENVDKALRINPGSAPALILKNSMNMANVPSH